MIDGKESKHYTDIAGALFDFKDNDHVRYVALTGDKDKGFNLLRVEEKLAPAK